ncbi:cation transporter [Carbonactinospora thermoautotrophica]|uniref:cation diffusion facilitator family transporter n=1 Tax=Carbonactinospora thermoautotrophica TaxID=1469144 RepID=UPI00226FBFFE|nr:cation diffusion facilitator family transporter [Carbonactinospora thermoautotrophica]MCX9193578.1 cation transporter [Carbonactinospora thermoautotrophica]
MGHGHAHGHGADVSRAGHRHRLAGALALTLGFVGVEAAVAVLGGSLALLSDAGHMLTDSLGLAMALTAVTLAGRVGRGGRFTYGLYRLEVLAALANAVLLFAVAGYVLWEAFQRLREPVEVAAAPMLLTAGVGLAVNAAALGLLRAGAAQSINVKAAYLEVFADAVGSVAVLAGAAVIAVTGWTWVDSAVGVGIGLFILPRVMRLARQALDVLVQAAPASVDPAAVRGDLASIPGVVEVHDLHLWTLTSQMEVATVHLAVQPGTDSHAVLDQAREIFQTRHGITHATVQVEPTDHKGCDQLHW